ncbi:MAG: hypothetical protein K6U89_15310, partial [Chloroflexi bacterium]|nr:hypothetical protein [Chloroflexota bacterium]
MSGEAAERELGEGYVERGLSLNQVEQRIELGQVNRVVDQTSRSLASIIRTNVFNRFNAVLG